MSHASCNCCPSGSVVNGELDLGLVPDSSAAATVNTAILNYYFANAASNDRPLFLPGKRYYINDEIVVPQLNGAMVLLGVGGLTMAYTQSAGAPRWAANTILTWVGLKRGQMGGEAKAMFRVNGAMCKMQGISLEGAEVLTGGVNNYPVGDDRVAYGIVIQHPDNPGDHSGKSMYRDLAFRFMNTGIYISYDTQETHADENHFSNLHFDSVANPFLIDNFQSISNYFEHIIVYANVEQGLFTATNVFDIRRAGKIVINNMTVNAAGGTVFRIGATPKAPNENEPWFRRGAGTLAVAGLYADSGTVTQGHTLDRPFKLIDMESPTVEANIEILGTLAFNTTYTHLERAAVNPRTVRITLNTDPVATLLLHARRINLPASLDVINNPTEGVSFNDGTGELEATVNISGGNNTVADLVAVLNGEGNNPANNAITRTDYRAEVGDNPTATIDGNTASTAIELVQLDEPLIVTRGTDSLLQLNVRSLDAVNAAKYPRLALQPLYSQPAFTGVHGVPTFMQPDYMPNIAPSDAIVAARAAALIWLESRNASDLAVNMDGDVTQWNDLSSNGNHVIPPGSGNRPAYHHNLINHRAAVHFDSATADDYLVNTTTTSFDGLTDFTIYVVYLPNSLSTNPQTLVSNSRIPSDLSWRLNTNADGEVELHCSTNGTTDSVSTGVAGLLLNSPNLIIVSRDSAAGVVTTIINGEMTKQSGLVTGMLATPAGADFHVSGFYNTSTTSVVQRIRGAVAALVILPTAAYDEVVADYLRAVYGVN